MKLNKSKESYLELLNNLQRKFNTTKNIVEQIEHMQKCIRKDTDTIQQDGWYLGRKALTDYESGYMQMTDMVALPEMYMVEALLNRLLNYYSIELENAINNFNNLEE